MDCLLSIHKQGLYIDALVHEVAQRRQKMSFGFKTFVKLQT
jgi:hypothetical protein